MIMAEAGRQGQLFGRDCRRADERLLFDVLASVHFRSHTGEPDAARIEHPMMFVRMLPCLCGRRGSVTWGSFDVALP
jgi:hypothetical protein